MANEKNYGPNCENIYWRIIMYQRIYNNYKSLTIVTVIIVSVLEWIRYIVRMAGTGTV